MPTDGRHTPSGAVPVPAPADRLEADEAFH